MTYSDVKKNRPCGKYTKCSCSPGCGECSEWNAYLRLLALEEIETRILLGKTIEQQKKEAIQMIELSEEESII